MAVGYSLGGLINDLYKLVYPIGICVDFWDGTNPNSVFPGTTWVLIDDGRFVRSSNTRTIGTVAGQIGSLGGSDTATISVDNIPSHVHRHDHRHSISHSHGQGWTNESGNHQHSVSGSTDTQGQHQHHILTLTTFNGEGSTPAAVNAGGQRDSYTDAAGQHYHNVSGTANWGGNHSHAAWVPDIAESVLSGWITEVLGGGLNTEATGGSQALNIENKYRCYGRWRRTA